MYVLLAPCSSMHNYDTEVKDRTVIAFNRLVDETQVMVAAAARVEH